MPTNGMTIDGLNTVSALTAQDKVPVWDNESSGEPTRKITAQNMANSVKSLASLPNTTEMNNAIAQSTASGTLDMTGVAGEYAKSGAIVTLILGKTKVALSVNTEIDLGELPYPLVSHASINYQIFCNDRTYKLRIGGNHLFCTYKGGAPLPSDAKPILETSLVYITT